MASPYDVSPYGASAAPVGPVTVNGASRITDVTGTVQRSLAQLGLFSGTIDGRPSGELRTALRKFQKNNKLRVTGTATSQTRKALSSAVRRALADEPATDSTAAPGMTVPQPTIPTIAAAGYGNSGIVPPWFGGGVGSTVPQVNATNQNSLAPGAQGGTQSVTNDNSNTSSSQGGSPYGFGASPLDSMLGAGGLGSPYGGFGSPLGAWGAPGPSITGQWYVNGSNPPQQGGISGFFRRLFG
jgi:peptidoglycan hydrolase-like protein with peptidoglycan-binding domain